MIIIIIILTKIVLLVKNTLKFVLSELIKLFKISKEQKGKTGRRANQ